MRERWLKGGEGCIDQLFGATTWLKAQIL